MLILYRLGIKTASNKCKINKSLLLINKSLPIDQIHLLLAKGVFTQIQKVGT